jgi:hypothetical protein
MEELRTNTFIDVLVDVGAREASRMLLISSGEAVYHRDLSEADGWLINPPHLFRSRSRTDVVLPCC